MRYFCRLPQSKKGVDISDGPNVSWINSFIVYRPCNKIELIFVMIYIFDNNYIGGL